MGDGIPPRYMAVCDGVAEAIYAAIFDDDLPAQGIERQLYRNAAVAALRAGVSEFQRFKSTGETP